MDVAIFDKRQRERLCDFWNKAEGRDKFGKLLQFAARCGSGVAREFLGNEELGKHLEIFWRQMLDARRMQWFGKSLMEWRTVMQTYDQNLPNDVKFAHMLARFGFVCRWAVENIMILLKHGVIKNFAGYVKWQDLNKIAKKFWTLSIIAGIMTEVFKIRHIMDDVVGEEKREAERNKCLRTMLCHACDASVPLVIAWDQKIPDSKVGFTHTISSIIQCQNLYPK